MRSVARPEGSPPNSGGRDHAERGHEGEGSTDVTQDSLVATLRVANPPPLTDRYAPRATLRVALHRETRPMDRVWENQGQSFSLYLKPER